MELKDGRCHYKSEASGETRKLWEKVEKNREAFIKEVRDVDPSRADRLMGLCYSPSKKDLEGLSPEASAHVLFCWAVSA